MNARAAELVADGTGRMALAGDQLYLDLDLSLDNLPAGSLLAVGQAVLAVKAPAAAAEGVLSGPGRRCRPKRSAERGEPGSGKPRSSVR